MSENKPRFVSSIDCMDGRSGYAVRRFVDERFGFHFIDRCTEPGMNYFSCTATEEQWNWIRCKVVDVSVAKHGSRIILLSGHDDCAGYVASEEEHVRAVLEAIARVRAWEFPVAEPVLLIGLWAHQASSEWWDWRVKILQEIVIEPVLERELAIA